MIALAENPVLVIGGATASGKSAIALRLARALREQGREAELICADSITVYKNFEIGAAKPSAAERREFRHHLLDVVEPGDEFTAGDFVRLSVPAIAGMHSRGVVPLLVGGTGFYLRALLRGMASNEEEDTSASNAIKAELLERASKEGWEALHREVLCLDPGSAPTVHVNDHYRVVRALQAMRLHGKPWSELNKHARSTGWRFSGTKFFCLDVEKAVLEERILARSRVMLEGGLMAEVKGLLDRGVPPSAKAMQSVGYKECVETLSGLHPETTLVERIAQATRKLAKSQRTWFRGEAGVVWLKAPFWESLLLALDAPPYGIEPKSPL